MPCPEDQSSEASSRYAILRDDQRENIVICLREKSMVHGAGRTFCATGFRSFSPFRSPICEGCPCYTGAA